MKRIYLDFCALGRPNDDQRQMRVRLETDAVFLIFEAVRQGRHTLVVSPVHLAEIRLIRNRFSGGAGSRRAYSSSSPVP